MLTDGEENVATEDTPGEIAQVHAAQLCKELDVRVYTIAYSDILRKLDIRFTRQFPHTIESWTETSRGRSPDAPELVTRATRKKRIQLDYWRRHDLADLRYREQLGLD